MIQYKKFSGTLEMWLSDERGWQWDSEKKQLDGRFNPDFYNKEYKFKKAESYELKRFIRAVFMAETTWGW